MKLVKILNKVRIYDEKINVEMTVGEIVMLRAISGNSTSYSVGERLLELGGHDDFARLVQTGDMNNKLFENLVKIQNEVLPK
jgi:hypothetical protein